MAANIAGGKGSRQRKSEVSDQTVASNWELVFGKKEKAVEPKPDLCSSTAASKNPDGSKETAFKNKK